MSLLDIRTVMFSQLFTDAVCTAVLVTLWLQYRDRYAGMFFWVVDFIFQTTAVLLISLRGSIPDWMSMGLSNTLVIAGALAGYLGLERFTGKKSSQVYNYILMAVFILVHFYFIYLHPDLEARDLNLSLVLLILCFQCAWLMLRRVGRGMTRMTQAVGWVFALFCLANLIRIIIILARPQPGNDFFKSGLYDALILVTFQILLILLGFCLALMVNRRLLAEVKIQEEKFTKAFHCSPYANTITRASDGQILDFNDNFLSTCGYSPTDVAGKTTLDLHIWARDEDRATVVNELSNGVRVKEREFQFRKKSGDLITGLFSAEIISMDDHPLILSSINDITEGKRAEEALLFSEKKFSKAFLTCPEAMSIASIKDGKYLDINDAFLNITGFQRSDVIGHTSTDLNVWVTADDRRRYIEQLTTNGQLHDFKTQYRMRSGAIRDFLVSSATIEISGETYSLNFIQDITERSQAEQAQQQSEFLFRGLFEASPDAVMLIDPHAPDISWPIVDCNAVACEMNGYRREELIGQSIDIVNIIPGSPAERIEYMKRLRAAGNLKLETFHRHKNGTIFPIEVSTTLIQVGERELVMGIDRDITASRQTQTLQEAVYRIAAAAETSRSLEELFYQIHQSILSVMPAENFYITLYDEAQNMLRFPYFRDAADEPFVGGIHPAKGLTAYVLRTGKSLLCTQAVHDDLESKGEIKLLGVPSAIWLGVPLMVEGKAIGAMVVQHYTDPKAYGEREQHMLEFVSTQVAIAIDRKRGEEALRQSEAELRALFASMHDVVLVIDRAGVYLKVAPTNPELLVQPSEDLLGKSLWDIFTSEKAGDFQKVMGQVLDSKQTAQIEYDLSIADRTVWFEASISPMTEDSTLWVAHDITQRKRFELTQNALYRITQAAITNGGIDVLYHSIHSILGELIPVENFYIALINPASNLISFPYYIDQYDQAPSTPTELQGLTGFVMRSRHPLLLSREHYDQLVGKGEVEMVGTPFVDWMGAPLEVEGRMIGVMAVQSYTPDIHFDQEDLNLLEFVSTQVAQAIERKRMEQEIINLSLTDDLTGLLNRRGFTLLAEQEMKLAHRINRSMLLFFGDVDNLKAINDSWGHAQGDLALQEISAILKETFREADIPARIGGDEFVVLALDASQESADILADRIKATLEAHNRSGDRPNQLFLSMGIAQYDPEAHCTLGELIARADGLMYAQKHAQKAKP